MSDHEGWQIADRKAQMANQRMVDGEWRIGAWASEPLCPYLTVRLLACDSATLRP